MSSDAQLKRDVFKQIQSAYPLLTVMVTRESDDQIILYHSSRKGDKLDSPFLEIKTGSLSELDKQKDITSFVWWLFGFECEKKDSNIFCKLLICPERMFQLHLKKSGTVTMTGSVKVPIQCGKHRDETRYVVIDDAEIFNFHVVDETKFVKPDIKEVFIHARVTYKQIQNALSQTYQECGIEEQKNMNLVTLVSEHILITEDMKKSRKKED
jgi:hypothetical protein